jgi:Flp pilus assembly protein TadG
MIQTRNRLRHLRDDEKGAYLVEFALILPVFLLLSMGIFDIAYSGYLRTAAQGQIQDAARLATLETVSVSTLDQTVVDAVRRINPAATVEFKRENYKNFGNVDQPENFTDTNGNGVRDPGECFEDLNSNSTWDPDVGRAGNGGAEDVVQYSAVVTYNRIFPFWNMVGLPQQNKLTVGTLLRNQPFSAQSARNPVAVCT